MPIQYLAKDGTIVIVDEEFTTQAHEEQMIATARADYVAPLKEAFIQMRAKEARMQQSATPGQRAIEGDAYVRRFYATPFQGPLEIWGIIWSLDTLAERERATGAPEAEVQAAVETFRDGYGRGWRYGEWFSVVEPGGEYGSAHVSTLELMTEYQFAAAKAAGWVTA